MRILFITYYFQPEPNFFMGLPFAKALKERGHQVQVLTGFPNYPGGRIYDGYAMKLLQREDFEGVPITRVPLYPSHDQSSLKRILSYTSLSMSQALLGPWLMKKSDIAYVVQGPATIALPAIAMRVLRRIPYVLDVRDLWPDSLPATGMFDNRFGLNIIGLWCRLMYKCAAKIVVPTPGIRRKLIERGVKQDKIELIYNWCDDALICRAGKNPELAKSLDMNGKFNVVFAGNMGKAQALDAVIDAAKIISSEHLNIQFVFFGGGIEVENLKNRVDSLELKNVIFHKRKPVSKIGPILRLADVLLVHLRDNPLFRITIPSKTQAYMALGRPILVGVKGDATDLVKKAGAGISCIPENPESIANSVIELYQMSSEQRVQMSNKGIEFYDKEMSFEIAVGKYERLFQEVIRS